MANSETQSTVGDSVGVVGSGQSRDAGPGHPRGLEGDARETIAELRREARSLAGRARRALVKPGVGASVAGAAVLAAGAAWGASEAAVAALAAYAVFRMLRRRTPGGGDRRERTRITAEAEARH